MILLLIPLLIVAVGAGLYTVFSSRFGLIVIGIVLCWILNNFDPAQDPMAQAMKEVQAHHDQWAAEDALWAKEHHH